MKVEPILCHDYDVGPFNPLSFEPRYKWNITFSGPISKTNPDIKHINIETTSPHGFKLTVHASPYSYGWFAAECRSLGFGGEGYWLGTNDPEDAIYRTEKFFKEWTEKLANFYTKFS